MKNNNKFYSVVGSKYLPGKTEDHVQTSMLPPHVYNVCFSDQIGFYLQKTDDLSVPDKMYGDVAESSKRILRTFNERTSSTGVLLVGAKGSGKSLLARTLCIDSGLPVILVTSSFTGDKFRGLIADIDQPAVVFFDEFEKVYNEPEQQQDLLSLFDGVYTTKKLFVLTANNKYKVDEHFHNRPGRIYYVKEYGGLTEDFVKEYCEDNLLPQYKHHAPLFNMLCDLIDDFSFDMLQSVVEEVNRYGETPQKAIELVNVRPPTYRSVSSKNQKFDVQIESSLWCLGKNTTVGSPLNNIEFDEVVITLRANQQNSYFKDNNLSFTSIVIHLNSEFLVWSDNSTKTMVFDIDTDYYGESTHETIRIILTPTIEKSWDYMADVYTKNRDNPLPPRVTDIKNIATRKKNSKKSINVKSTKL